MWGVQAQGVKDRMKNFVLDDSGSQGGQGGRVEVGGVDRGRGEGEPVYIDRQPQSE